MENYAITRARIDRIIAFTNDVQKLSITAAKRGQVPLHRLKKVQSYRLAFTEMKNDPLLGQAADALLEVIDLCGDLRKKMKAGKESESIEICKKITDLLLSTKEVIDRADTVNGCVTS